MADAVGLVANVIVLGEVAATVIALKRLWEQVRDLPRCIQIQVNQIEALNSVMKELKPNETPFGHPHRSPEHDVS